MRKADTSDEKLIIDLLINSFYGNPSVMTVIKNDQNTKNRLKVLAKYVFKIALKREGVFVSSDNTGFAICYKYNELKETLTDYWHQIELVVKAIGIDRVLKIMKRDNYIKEIRPQSGEFFYFWFLGVTKEGRGHGAAKELAFSIIKESEEKKLPIYLETSVEKNAKVYQRFGFEVYHTWIPENGDTPLWFMKREV